MAYRIVMFGKTYVPIGETESNLVLKTAGDIQVKTKDRFITIFKNGKLATGDSTEMFSVNSVDNIKKTGVYLVSSITELGDEQQDVYLCIDGVKVLLSSSTEGFISYTAVQELKPENLLQAGKNIGLYFDTLQAAKDQNLTSGIVYVLDEQKLYKIVNGEFLDFTSTATDNQGSTDSGSEESEIPDSLQIGILFLDGTAGIVNSEGQLVLQIDGNEYIKLMSGSIQVRQDVILDPEIKVYYRGGTQKKSGFWLYIENGESYLEIDNLIVHNSSNNYTPKLYSTYVGSKVKSLISQAAWVSAPTDISLTLKYPAEFNVGDLIMIQTAGGNKAEITHREDSDGITTTQILSVTLETAPSQITKLKVTYSYVIDDDGNTSEKTAEVTIDPNQANVGDDGDSDDGGNNYGEVTISESIDSIKSVEIISGDKDIYFIDEDGVQHGGSSLPIAMTGTVTGTAPLTINVPSQSDLSNSILSNLEYSVIYKIGSTGTSETVLIHGDENISLVEYTESGGAVEKKTTTQLGNLEEIPNPADNSKSLEGHGIYSDNGAFKNPKLFGTTFEGDSEGWYPKYGENLELPTDIESASYDKVVPTVGWIKKLIDTVTEKAINKFIEEKLPGIINQAIQDALDAQTSE